MSTAAKIKHEIHGTKLVPMTTSVKLELSSPAKLRELLAVDHGWTFIPLSSSLLINFGVYQL